MIGPFLVLSLIGLSLFYLQNLALFPSVQLRLLSVLVFYVSLRPSFALAFALALFLGILQDSFDLTPLGMHVNGALALVAAGRFARRRFLIAGLTGRLDFGLPRENLIGAQESAMGKGARAGVSLKLDF